MIQDLIHRKIVQNKERIEEWFQAQRECLEFVPFYSSFDIRDSSFKVVPVDANVFPAGFNNICQVDKDSAVDLVRDYLQQQGFGSGRRILLLTEEHTGNPYYWDNVLTLKTLLEGANQQVFLAIPRLLTEPLQVQSASGVHLQVHAAERQGDQVFVAGEPMDLVISNNDFSEEYPDWIAGLATPVNPPHRMGWHRRKKSDFFEEYNKLADQFAELIGLDPWHLRVETELFEKFDINSSESREALAQCVDSFLQKIRAKYREQGIEEPPFVFVKNNSGTYGLGVIKVNSGDEVRSWSYKSRKKMKAAKGGRAIEQVIIQEGVPTAVTSGGETAEPAIYMVGCQLAGGFLRTHGKKGKDESLNSPGAVYKRLCVSDLSVDVEGSPMENVYGWVARLGLLSISRESKKLL